VRCLLLASLAVATALTAGSSAHAEQPNPSGPSATSAPTVEVPTREAESGTKQDAPPTPDAAAPAPKAAKGRAPRVELPVTKDAEAERFSPRVVAPVLGVSLPSDHLDVREPRGFLGTRATHLAVGWSLVGTGVLSSVAAGTLAWQASRIDVSPTTTNGAASTAHQPERTPQQAQQAQQERADKRAVSAVMAGAGLAFLASGGLTLLTAPAPRGGPNTRVGAMMTPSGGYVGVTGKW
jgi:hypothetical protein